MSNEKKGMVAGFLSYAIWGVFPLYWKMLEHVSSTEILLSRIIWSFVFTIITIVLIGMRKELVADLKYLWQHKPLLWQLMGASLFISLNWFLYIWAVTNEHIIETSLGYYINPLLSVILGVVVFKESLSRVQWFATGVAFVGVLILSINYGSIPWVALLLALSFGLYGMLKKKIPLDPIRGLAIETLFILPIALSYYVYLFATNSVSFLNVDVKTNVLLIVSGIVTAIPLVLFAKGAQNVPLYVMGFLQYISPTTMLILGVLLYKEPFTQIELIAFSIIWLALILFSSSKFIEFRRSHEQTRKAA
ncbi:MAG: EamA family transporter RarD [Lysinibacillus sp.]